MSTRMLSRIVVPLSLVLPLACTPGPSAEATGDASTATTDDPAPSTDASPPGSTSTGPGPADATTDGTTPATTSATETSVDSTTQSAVDSTTEALATDDSTGADPALGMIAGECGLIDAMEIDSPSPFTFENAIDFRDLGFDYDLLTPGGQQVFDAGNLGGSSLESEVVAFEVLARCDGATLLATEAEIQYTDPMGIKTDLLVEIDGRAVGVSVTRAVGFPFDAPYTELQATTLLTDKLEDILESTANVAPRDAWDKQILHVLAYADMHAQSILAAHAGLPPEITADTILVITVTHGNDEFVY